MTQNYWQQYLALKQNERLFFPREAAKKMGISECELIVSNPDAVYLGEDMRSLVLRLKELGLVECIVRNEVAVHEKSGVYENVSMTKTMGIALNVGELDLRIFAKQWKHAVALEDKSRSPTSYSIQFYDAFGEAIQKVFLRDESKVEAWHTLVNDFANNNLPSGFRQPEEIHHTPNKLGDDDLAAFHQRWLELKDVHHFRGILETFSLSRLDAYRQAPENHAFSVGASAFEKAFQAACEKDIKIMIFVGNRGIVQIQSGKVHNVIRKHGWLNIIDKKEEHFCLHLKDEDLSDAWAVRRPTRDGIVTCLEGFDVHGKSKIIVFGLREEGDTEQNAWQEIVQAIIDERT